MSQKATTGLWSIALYATAMNFGIRWIATGAATGPVAIPIWLLAAALFLAPLVIATLDLSARFPNEGAVYAWSGQTLGPFAGFMCGWIYWACNLPFFSGQLFFIVNLAAEAMGGPYAALLKTPMASFMVASTLILGVGFMHSKGIGVGKWLPSLGALASIGLLVFLVATGYILWTSQGTATDFAKADYLPKWDANGAILWSTMVFAYGGAEGVALLRNEAKGGVVTIVRALSLVGLFLALAYAIGTMAMLIILPQDQASRLGGLAEAMAVALAKLHLSPLRPLALGALAFALLGGLSAWFGAAARLPFAAGIDKTLPEALGRRDPKTGAPVTAIWIQTALVILICGLSQAGETVASAYDFVVAMSVLSYALPFLFLFAAYAKAQALDHPEAEWRTPGGPKVARRIAALGFVVALSAILGSLVPSPEAHDPLQATLKLIGASLVLMLSGAALYIFGKRAS